MFSAFFGAIGNLFTIIFMSPIYNGLVVLYHLFGDFALAIVVLTLIIKLLLFPLTLQQLKSTKANQALQPQIQEIRRKYANDQQQMAVAMQSLYKEYGVNPMAGCLPLLVQLPVLYGLYFAFNTVVRSNGKLESVNSPIYPFIPKFTHFPDVSFRWFEWLSFLNPVFHVNWTWTFSLNQPDPTHILPVLAGLATFLSLRMAQPKTAPVVEKNGKAAPPDPTMQSMKMMQYIMPFFTGFLAWSFPAGLGVYWTVSSLFQAVQQYFVTGLGALGPATKPATSKSSASSSSSTRTASSRVVESDAKVVEDEDEDDSEAAATSSAKTSAAGSNGSSSSSSTKRQRSGSASARRRSSTSRSARRA